MNKTEDGNPNSKAWLNYIYDNALISISRQHQCVVPDSVLLYVVRRVVCFKKGPIHNCAVLIVDLSAGTNIRKISCNKSISFLVLAQCLLSFSQFWSNSKKLCVYLCCFILHTTTRPEDGEVPSLHLWLVLYIWCCPLHWQIMCGRRDRMVQRIAEECVSLEVTDISHLQLINSYQMQWTSILALTYMEVSSTGVCQQKWQW